MEEKTVAPEVAEAAPAAVEEKKEVFFTSSANTYVPASEPVVTSANETIVEEQPFQPIMKAKSTFETTPAPVSATTAPPQDNSAKSTYKDYETIFSAIKRIKKN